MIDERDGVVLSAAWAGRLPYELLVAPARARGRSLDEPGLAVALDLAADGLRRLHASRGRDAANLWLHAPGHWHLEVSRG